MNARRKLIGLSALVVAGAASTATIDEIEVNDDDGMYRLYAETRLAASPEAIQAVLTDYERFGRISSVYTEYGYLDPQADGTPTVYTQMRGCVMKIFCRTLTRVERLEINEPTHIRTVTIPHRSDFRHSVSEWRIEAFDSGSRMIYTLEMEPDFWVPPIIGSGILRRTLERGGADAVDRIERLALAEEAVQRDE
jgi:hypothetical protein